MAEQQKSKPYIYNQAFSGVSFAQVGEKQSLYLFAAKGGDGSANIVIPKSEVVAFREAFSGLLSVSAPGFVFKDPLDPANKFTLNPNASNRATEREALHRHIRVHNKKKADKAWLVLDPIVTLTEQGILFEVVDKRGLQVAAYLIKSSGYSGSVQSGSVRVEAGADLVETLVSLNGRSDLQIHIGESFADLGAEHKYVGAIEKTFPVPKSWQRMGLQLLASSALEATSFSMAPIDLYNIVRALHLRSGDKGMRILLVDGRKPRISIAPWDWTMVTTGADYEGATTQIDLMEYDAITRFQSLVPYVSHASLRMVGEALPSFWTLSAENFSLVLGMSNFKPTNWTKGLLLNKYLPRHRLESSDLGRVVSVDKGNANTVTQGIQLDTYSMVVDGQSYRRSYINGADIKSLAHRNGQEEVAYRLVRKNRVHVKSTVEPNGRRVLMTATPQRFRLGSGNGSKSNLQMAINDVPERQYSTVSEPQKEFQFNEPMFQPRLAILQNGATRLPGCSCTYYRKYGDKKPCAHVQALYIQYLNDAEKADASNVELTSRTLVKLPQNQKDPESVHLLRLQSKRVIEEWGSFFELNNQTCRRQVLAFNQIEDARACFFGRVSDLEKEGFTNAG